MKPNAINEQWFPTVLVTGDDSELRSDLVNLLLLEGYYVLEAHDAADAFHIAIVHSRPIHLLLMDLGMEGSSLLAARLRPYRDEMRVLFRTKTDDMDKLLAKVGELLKPSTNGASAA